MADKYIKIRGANEHNLKNISLDTLSSYARLLLGQIVMP